MTKSHGKNSVRREFSNAEWGDVSTSTRRYVLIPPRVAPKPTTGGLAGAAGVAHSDRCSLLLWVAGGHLWGSHQVVVAAAVQQAQERLRTRTSKPMDLLHEIVAWLEQEHQDGVLKGAYSTASLIAVVSDEDLWSWHTSPHGLACGLVNALRFCSTDLRTPILRAHGQLPVRAWSSPGAHLADAASSIFCVGTPDGYEEIRCSLGNGEIAMAFDRACLPFGPWPEFPWAPRSLWEMEAAWNYGLPGHTLVLGRIEIEDLSLPAGWQATEVPVSARCPNSVS